MELLGKLLFDEGTDAESPEGGVKFTGTCAGKYGGGTGRNVADEAGKVVKSAAVSGSWQDGEAGVVGVLYRIEIKAVGLGLVFGEKADPKVEAQAAVPFFTKDVAEFQLQAGNVINLPFASKTFCGLQTVEEQIRSGDLGGIIVAPVGRQVSKVAGGVHSYIAVVVFMVDTRYRISRIGGSRLGNAKVQLCIVKGLLTDAEAVKKAK